MTTVCRVCRALLPEAPIHPCPSCGASRTLPTAVEILREWRWEIIKDGIEEATRRSRDCSHDCNHVSISTGLEGIGYRRATVRRCTFLWYMEEYPDGDGISHDTFEYRL
jgi:hypothetical protein